MTLLAVVVLHFLSIQTLDGRTIYINPRHIVTVAESREETDPTKRLTAKVHCVISLSDGKFLTVAEECASVRKRLRDAATIR